MGSTEVAEKQPKKEPKWDILKPQVIGPEDDHYLERVKLIVTPLFSIMLHRIYRPDNQRELHDHPWSFFSIVLRGWYGENVPRADGTQQYKKRRWFNFKWAEDRHSIRIVSRKPVWTLVFTGPRRRIWGFWIQSTTERYCPGCGFTYPTSAYYCARECGPLRPAENFVPHHKYEKLNKA